jgi:hypothetical protein
MTSEKLHGVVHALSIDRPIFHSEADFQHALAWTIQKTYPDFEVRLEKREGPKGNEKYFDICIIVSSRIIPIEVKYKTRALQWKIIGRDRVENYSLKYHAAYGLVRYDFIKDIARIEEYKNGGFVIFLTNDKLYWEESSYKGFDDGFKIHEGKKLRGVLRWKPGIAPGSIKGREKPITLKGEYALHWENYSALKDESSPQPSNATFRYVLIEVQKGISHTR